MTRLDWDRVAVENRDQRHKTEIENRRASAASGNERSKPQSGRAPSVFVKCDYCYASVKAANIAKHTNKVHPLQTPIKSSIKPSRIYKLSPSGAEPVERQKTRQEQAGESMCPNDQIVATSPNTLATELAVHLPNAILKLARFKGAEVKTPTDSIPGEIAEMIRRLFKIPG
jgi:hypothetical protein